MGVQLGLQPRLLLAQPRNRRSCPATRARRASPLSPAPGTTRRPRVSLSAMLMRLLSCHIAARLPSEFPPPAKWGDHPIYSFLLHCYKSPRRISGISGAVLGGPASGIKGARSAVWEARLPGRPNQNPRGHRASAVHRCSRSCGFSWPSILHLSVFFARRGANSPWTPPRKTRNKARFL